MDSAGRIQNHILAMQERLVVVDERKMPSKGVLGKHDMHAKFRRHHYTIQGILFAFSLMPRLIVPSSFSQKNSWEGWKNVQVCV